VPLRGLNGQPRRPPSNKSINKLLELIRASDSVAHRR
jgi:hypothetical protein